VFCRYIQKALDSIFAVTLDDIPSMEDIQNKYNDIQDSVSGATASVVQAFESAKDMFKKTETSIEAGLQQFYQDVGNLTPEIRENLIVALAQAAVDADSTQINEILATIAQSILDDSDKDKIVECAAEALGHVTEHFYEMAPGLMGALINEIDEAGDVAVKSVRIISDSVEAALSEYVVVVMVMVPILIFHCFQKSLTNDIFFVLLFRSSFLFFFVLLCVLLCVLLRALFRVLLRALFRVLLRALRMFLLSHSQLFQTYNRTC
jgi:hypothetical protein